MKQSTEPAPKPIFGGHEKFVFRYGWLKKGVDGVAANPTVFSSDHALVTLGVGKNMVRSIRHWCLATNLLEEGTLHVRGLQPTALGGQILTEAGWDPYLEDTGTLWLIHWLLCTNKVRALIWGLTFSRFYEPEFSKRQLTAFVEQQLQRMNVRTTTGTIEREIDCFLRTYVVSTRAHSSTVTEEALDCPLSELDLIRFDSEDAVYRLVTGPKATLPTQIVAYALLDYLATFGDNRRTIAVDDCVYQEGSPGQIFRLDENSVMEYLEAFCGLTHGLVQLDETAGLRQLYLSDALHTEIDGLKSELLERYYGR